MKRSWAEVRENVIRSKHEQERQKTSSKTTISNLSSDIITNILSRLPAKTLLNCSCVCKAWRNVISTPEFAQSYLEVSVPQEVMLRPDGPGSLSRTLYLVDLDELKPYAELVLPQNDDLAFSGIDIVNSCNGLVCLCGYFEKNPVLVCNPLTRQYINIPRIDKHKPKPTVSFCNNSPINCECALCLAYEDKFDSQKELVASGFGFSPKTNQYKVIRIFEQRFSHGFGGLNSYGKSAEIYTLGEKSWRSIEFSPQFPHNLLFGTYVKGKMNWVCAINDKPEFIISFNFETENCEVLSLPPFISAGRKMEVSMMRMQELEGCLCVCDFYSATFMDVWVMNNLGRRKLWTKSCVVYMFHEGICEPIKLLNKKEVLMIQGLKGLVSYNCSSMKMKYHKIRGIQSNFGASIYMPSLVSLKDIVKGGNVEVLTVKN